MKYEFTGKFKLIYHCGDKVWVSCPSTIHGLPVAMTAVKQIRSTSTGELSGWIERVDNLCVDSHSYISPNTIILGSAKIKTSHIEGINIIKDAIITNSNICNSTIIGNSELNSCDIGTSSIIGDCKFGSCVLQRTQIIGNVDAFMSNMRKIELTGEVSLPVGIKLYDPLVALLYSS